MWSVAAVTDDTAPDPRFQVRRVLLGDGGESWTVLKRRLGEIRALAWLPD